jgi:hypothetical protein
MKNTASHVTPCSLVFPRKVLLLCAERWGEGRNTRISKAEFCYLSNIVTCRLKMAKGIDRLFTLYQTTRLHIPADVIVHCRETMKSHSSFLV